MIYNFEDIFRILLSENYRNSATNTFDIIVTDLYLSRNQGFITKNKKKKLLKSKLDWRQKSWILMHLEQLPGDLHFNIMILTTRKFIKIETWSTRKIMGADIFGIIVVDLHSKIRIFPRGSYRKLELRQKSRLLSYLM